MAKHTRTGQRRRENRARFWRGELATATSAAGQFHHATRWLHALTHHADPALADRALTQAARAVADVCVELERAVGPTEWDRK